MSSNNNNNSEMTGLAVVVAVLGFIGLFIFAVLAFLAFVCTVLALLAWDKPLKLGKNTTLEPEEARTFVLRGLAGAALLPAFAVFSALLFGFNIQDNAWFYLIVGGYVGGSIGLEILFAEESQQATQTRAVVPVEQIPPPVTQPAQRQVSPQPFRFASWDDEDECP